MAQPAPYNRAFNFSNWQAQHPTEPIPAAQIDIELSRIKAVTDSIRSVIAAIQRDDLALANRSVGFDQLKTEIDIGVNPPSTWATSTNYVVRDTVFRSQKFYICLVSHVSGTFSTDLAADKWEEVADFTAAQSAALVVYDNNTSGLSAENMQDAMDELVANIQVTSVHGRTGDVVAAASDYDADQVDFDATGLAHTDATDVQEAIADVDAAITLWGVPTGAVMDWAGTTAPTGWLLCYGQTVSRTTYARLFSAIGDTWGVGDGSTTFGIPDYRGRVAAGQDDMGGTSADRLTGVYAGGVNGDTLGAAGGAETHTLTTDTIPSHTHAAGTLATASAGDHAHNLTGFAGNIGGADQVVVPTGGNIGVVTSTAGAHTHTITGSTGSTGVGQAHNNVQPTLIVNKIIRT